MFFVLKRLLKYGLGTLPRQTLHVKQKTSDLYWPDKNGAPRTSQISNAEELEMLQARLPELIKKGFGRSLHIRHLDSGSSNACEWEITALLNPVYDVQRFGIDFVASPRHADMLLVTGGVTRNLEEAVRKTLAATPTPKIVIAVGDDACGTGFVGRTYVHYGRVNQIIPVDVYIPGDPPTPVDILQGILKALEQKSG